MDGHLMDGLRCTGCGAEYTPDRPRSLCESCGAPLQVRYDLDRVRRTMSPKDVATRERSLWRYRELLPGPYEERVTLGEGMTPLVPLPRLGRAFGLDELYVKNEAENPTGSFKDRGASVALTMYKALGVPSIVLLSSGNAAGSWALYGRRAGIEVHVILHDDAILQAKLDLIAAGAATETFHGGKAQGMKLLDRRVEEGCFSVQAFHEPYRQEGKKTMGLELAEQFSWRMPEVIIFPTGGGHGVVSLWKAATELRDLGWLEGNMPRIYAAQMDGCAPVARAIDEGTPTVRPWETVDVIPCGLRTPNPFASDLILRALRESGGGAVAARMDDVRSLLLRTAREEGLTLSPEGAVALDAARQLAERGELQGGERVVVFNTASAHRYTETWREICDSAGAGLANPR